MGLPDDWALSFYSSTAPLPIHVNGDDRPDLCCQPGAWDLFAVNPRELGEPLDDRLIDVCALHNIDPHLVDDELESRGWERHDDGYRATLVEIVTRMLVKYWSGTIGNVLNDFCRQTRTLMPVFRQTAGHLAYLNRVMRRNRHLGWDNFRAARAHRAYRAKQQRSARR